MKIKYTLTFKLLCVTSLFFFLVGCLTFFLPEIKAKVTEIRYAPFASGGYEGIPRIRRSTGATSNSALLFATYDYKVNSIEYSSWGIAEKYDGDFVTVKYLPIFPSLTFSSSFPYFLFCVFFSFITIGVRTIVVWVTTILRKHA